MNNKDDKIEDFFKGKFKLEERQQILDEIRNDPDLMFKYNLWLTMRRVYSKPEYIKVLDKVDDAYQKHMKAYPKIETNTTKSLFSGKVFTYALAAVVVMGIILTMVLLSERPSEQELYRKYYAAFDHQVTYRHNDKAAVKLNRAMELYRSGSYREAAEVFRQAEESFSEIANFFLGLCYLEMEEFAQAAEHLEAVAEGSELKQEAQWYLALARLAEGKREETRKTLRVIVDTPGHYYHDQAQSLLEELG